MKNLINSILVLENNEKYVVLNQAIYKDKNYYLVAKITPDEQDVTEEVKIIEELEQDGKTGVKLVTDKDMIELLTKYLAPAV